MHLAQFGEDTDGVLQGIVRLVQPADPNASLFTHWQAAFSALVTTVTRLSGLQFSSRMVIHEGVLHRCLMLLARRVDEGRLRRALAIFTRLETILPGSSDIPSTSTAYDEMLADFPHCQCSVDTTGYVDDTFWFSCDFQVYHFLDELVNEAQLLGYNIGYQANIIPGQANANLIRKIRYNLVCLANIAGLPPMVLERQRQIINRLIHPHALLDEYLGVDNIDAARWLAQSLTARFIAYAGPSFDPPQFECVADGYTDFLESGIHTAMVREFSPDEYGSHLIDMNTRDTVMSWCPRIRAATGNASLAVATVDETQEAVAGANLGIHEGPGRYAFISYRHADFARIEPTLQFMQQNGYPFWFDSGIPGASEWDEYIEQRIEECSMLVLFISNSAIESKYVRREVKFADAIGKPIIGVYLEQTELSHGFKMLLLTNQTINLADASYRKKLTDALCFTEFCTNGVRGN